jgi:hypothetical protein
MIMKRYCSNNRLEVVSYKTTTYDAIYNSESIYDFFKSNYIKENLITDFVVYSKSYFLHDIKRKELKDAGVQILHNIVNKTVNIEKL